MNEPQNSQIPYFAIKFHNLYFHDIFTIPENYDKMLKKTLEKFEPNFNDTMLVLISDHGHRFMPYAQSDKGLAEFTNPFLSVKLPCKFINTTFLDNFKSNTNKLETFF